MYNFSTSALGGIKYRTQKNVCYDLVRRITGCIHKVGTSYPADYEPSFHVFPHFNL